MFLFDTIETKSSNTNSFEKVLEYKVTEKRIMINTETNLRFVFRFAKKLLVFEIDMYTSVTEIL